MATMRGVLKFFGQLGFFLVVLGCVAVSCAPVGSITGVERLDGGEPTGILMDVSAWQVLTDGVPAPRYTVSVLAAGGAAPPEVTAAWADAAARRSYGWLRVAVTAVYVPLTGLLLWRLWHSLSQLRAASVLAALLLLGVGVIALLSVLPAPTGRLLLQPAERVDLQLQALQVNTTPLAAAGGAILLLIGQRVYGNR